MESAFCWRARRSGSGHSQVQLAGVPQRSTGVPQGTSCQSGPSDSRQPTPGPSAASRRGQPQPPSGAPVNPSWHWARRVLLDEALQRKPAVARASGPTPRRPAWAARHCARSSAVGLGGWPAQAPSHRPAPRRTASLMRSTVYAPPSRPVGERRDRALLASRRRRAKTRRARGPRGPSSTAPGLSSGKRAARTRMGLPA